MTKVYIVAVGVDQEDYPGSDAIESIYGVFSTKRKAQEARERLNDENAVVIPATLDALINDENVKVYAGFFHWRSGIWESVGLCYSSILRSTYPAGGRNVDLRQDMVKVYSCNGEEDAENFARRFCELFVKNERYDNGNPEMHKCIKTGMLPDEQIGN